jgi:Tfp pilus assembly protein PilV
MGLPEAMIAFIVIGLPTIALFALVSRVLRHREKRMELEAQIAAAKAAESHPRPDFLEQRVRVLERIVTDKGMNVAEEIERLRDERAR